MTTVLGVVGVWILLGVVHLFATKAGYKAGAIAGVDEGTRALSRRFDAGEMSAPW